MMNKKPLNNFNLILRKAILLCIYFLAFGCKAQTTILSDINLLKPTHEIENKNIKEVIDFMLTDNEFHNWRKNENKLLVISSLSKDNKDLVRAITLYRDKISIMGIPENYSGYFMYKDVFIVFYGDDKPYLKRTKNKILPNLFNFDGNHQKLTSPEYYGAEFTVDHDKVFVNEKNWFGSPVIK